MRRGKVFQRFLAALLAFVMVVGLMPIGAFATESETTVPETTVPETTVPETTVPETTVPETTVPETTVPETTVPETTVPNSSEINAVVLDLDEEIETASEDPVNERTDIDYLFIATDRHADESIIGTLINAMEEDIGGNELDYLALGGDMVGSGNSHPAYNSSTVLSEVTGATSSLSATNVDIVAGIHDMNCNDDAGILLPFEQGGAKIYEGNKYYVYGVEESCIAEEYDSTWWQSEADAFVNWANGTDIDQSKAIVVVSHYPLHAKRDDNDGGYVWHTALNQVATAGGNDVVRNVLFFHGHNHTEDKTEYIYNVGDSMSLQNGSKTTSEAICYTYATAGYLSQQRGNGQATLVTIDANNIKLTKYSTNGSSSMTSVVRLAPVVVPTLTGITVEGQTEYTVGDEFVAPTVTAVYSDETKNTVLTAEEYTVEGDYKMDTVGEYTLTYTYEGMSATYTFTVKAAPVTLTGITVEGQTEYTVGDEFVAPKVTAVYSDETKNTVLTAEEYAVEGDYKMDTVGEYTLTYTYEGMSATYTFTVKAAPVTLSSIAISGTAEYTVGDELALTVTATYSDGTTADVTADANLSGYDMSAAGEYTVKAEYEGMTAEYSITVSEKEEEPSEPEETITEQTYYDNEELPWAAMTATAENGTVTDIYDENNTTVNDMFEDAYWYGYNFALEGQVADTTVTIKLWLDPAEMSSENLAVYHLNEETGLYEEVTEYTVATDEDDVEYITISNAALGTYVYGTPAQIVEEGAVLTEQLSISAPTKNAYFDSDVEDHETTDAEGNTVTEKVIYLDITGLEVVASYDNGETKTLDWDSFGEVEGGYSLTFAPMVVDGEVQYGEIVVTVSYTEGDVTATGTFSVWVCQENVTTDSNVSVSFDTASVVDLDVKTEEATETITTALANKLEGELTVYNITAAYANGFDKLQGTASITLPIPDGVTNPVVYYVSDDGSEIEEMPTTVNEDGTLTFTTTHFSTFVLGEGYEEVEGSETTTNVWKLTSELSNNGTYLIVNTNAVGSGYALLNNNGSVSAVAVTVETNGTDTYYIKLDNANAVWTATGSNTSWAFANNSSNLGYTREDTSYGLGTSYSYSLNTAAASAITWSLNANVLSVSLQSGTFLGSSSGNNTYYLTGGSSWSMSTDSANVYFYTPGTITEGTPAGTYTIEGAADPEEQVALNGQTVALSYKTYFTEEGSAAVEQAPSTAPTVKYVFIDADGNEIAGTIGSIEGSTLTLNGTEGTDTICVVYTWTDSDGVEHQIYDDFTVTAAAIPDDQYTITMHKQATDADGNPVAGDEITAPITIKNIMNGMQDSVWAVVKANGIDLGALGDQLHWSISGDPIGEINSETGVVTFNGTEGTATVTASFTCPGGRVIQASVTYSVTVGAYTVPEDGTDDFPEYPDPGAIRYDKHATAVGNFSETGITQVELSMTGVPYGTDQAIDVVVMLDMTGSMSSNGMKAAVAAAKAFVEKIVVDGEDADGNKTYNDNRVAVYQFNSSGIGTYFNLQTIDSDSELETALNKIVASQSSGGTPFDEAAQKCHDVLADAKTDGTGNDRKQFCVFMSDGGPTTYEGSDGYTYYGGNASGDRKITSYIGGYTSSSASSWTYSLPTEYWTDDMKADGVTVYTVGLLLQNVPSNPSPYSSMTSSTYDSTTDSLTTIGSHYYFTSTILKNMASDTNKYIDIFSVDNASKATAAFESIAQSILDAATDVKVTDKITSDYTMVFEAPNSVVSDALPDGQEMYIEVKDYVLNPVYGSDGTTIVDYSRGSAASLMKLYLGKSGSTYYAASDANGTAYAEPTFNQTAIGTMYYWTTSPTASGVSVTVGDNTYYFDEAGISNMDENYVTANWYNMASGAYASGNITTTNIVDDDSGEVTGTNSVCNDLIIATPYFVYNASTKILTWTTAKLSTSEITLSYFLYLDESGGYSGAEDETPAGTYETNEYAYLSYTNFQGTDCQQTFPVPQMTWNGAQVSYVFYLVNDQGQPVNRAGKVVPFSEAVYVTDVFTHAIVWNDLEQTASLEAEYLANDLVPDVYKLYDNGATYNIHVFEDEKGQNLNNHFIIGSSSSTYTTYVFNAKSDATKYKQPATYAATSSYKCKEYVENGQYTDDKGAYNIVTKTGATVVETGFDFSNTTVAFAVTWTPGLVEDTVVVDYGLDVVIDVIKNDNMAAGVVGVRTTAPSGVATDGTYDRVEADTMTSVDLYIDANNDEGSLKELKIGTATVENLTSVRFSLDKTNGMQFTNPAVFYYEADVNFYDSNNELQTTSMYSKVTVIPATTVYYEDDFVTLSATGTAEWKTEGTVVSNGVQATDRPGVDKLGFTGYDSDNNYGYDEVYDSTTSSMYSLGTAKKITVSSGNAGRAAFSFYGTGFDVISMTSNTTGTIFNKLYRVNDDGSNTEVKSWVVDTYYGYTRDDEGNWIVSENTPNSIYQVPVIKVSGLEYGKYYVTVTASYSDVFDHETTSTPTSYDYYFDAVRIYDPTGNNNDVANDAYVKDNEGWPVYEELRNNIIAASNYKVTENEDGTVTVSGENLTGAIFIDCNDANTSIADYVNYGPNNELYLAPEQAIAFNVNLPENVADVQLGIKVGNFFTDSSGKPYTSIIYKINNEEYEVSTATDMYYSILDYAKAGTVTIKNVSGGILSLTNIKVTHTSAPADTSGISLLSMDGESAGVALMMLRRAPAEEEIPEETEPEATVPETTVPEETEPETTVPETTVPEETEAEITVPETTVPEETEPEADRVETIVNTITTIVNKITNTLSNLFGRWFR